MYRIYFKASIYIVVASVMMVAIASIVIINLGERVSNVLSSTTAMASSWHTICLVINGVEAKLYLADTSSKQTEGYMFKTPQISSESVLLECFLTYQPSRAIQLHLP
ncbi:MAG: hypothetical protein ACO2O0_01020 [Desulfurococcales archaeon]|jgi:hypothetical protein